MDSNDVKLKELSLAEKQLEAETQLRNAEIELKRKELAQKEMAPSNKLHWNSPVTLGVFGGIFTLMTAIVTNYYQSQSETLQRKYETSQRTQEQQAQLALESKKFQWDLIQKAINGSEEYSSTAKNFSFLWKAGLIPDYPGVSELLKTPDELPINANFGDVSASERTRMQYFETPSDNRLRVSDTKEFPFNNICFITSAAGNGYRSIGTGFFVSPRVIITAAFNVHPGPGGDFFNSFDVYPARNGRPDKLTAAVRVETTSEWVNSGAQEHCFGVLILDEDVEGVVPLQLGVLDTGELERAFLNVVGYPGDEVNLVVDHAPMYSLSGRVRQVSPQEIYHDASTTGGMGGAPLILVTNDNEVQVLGIHTFGEAPNQPFKKAVRITDSVKDQITEWIEEAK